MSAPDKVFETDDGIKVYRYRDGRQTARDDRDKLNPTYAGAIFSGVDPELFSRYVRATRLRFSLPTQVERSAADDRESEDHEKTGKTWAERCVDEEGGCSFQPGDYPRSRSAEGAALTHAFERDAMDEAALFWGYSSVPEDGVSWWRALPTRTAS